MTFIKDILSIEAEAKNIVEKAHSDAKLNLANANKKHESAISSTTETLKSEQASSIEAQKTTLDAIYKKAYSKHKIEIQKIELNALNNRAKAVTLVLESIIN